MSAAPHEQRRPFEKPSWRREHVATSYIHTCYRIRDPQKSEDFYVNKLGMKKVGEMDLGSATGGRRIVALEEVADSIPVGHSLTLTGILTTASLGVTQRYAANAFRCKEATFRLWYGSTNLTRSWSRSAVRVRSSAHSFYSLAYREFAT